MPLPHGVTERETVAALLRVESDLERALASCPKKPREREAWRNAVTTLLIETARGRLFLSQLQAQRSASAAEEEERLAS